MTEINNISLNINVNLNYVDEKKCSEILNFFGRYEINKFITFSDLNKIFNLENRKYFTIEMKRGDLDKDQPIENFEIDIKG